MPTERLRVLLISDDAGFARAARDMLASNREGEFELVWAPTLPEGMPLLRHGGLDAVIVDFTLADGAGLATIGLVKTQSVRIPIIMLGAVDEDAIAVQSVHDGAQEYIVKSHLTAAWLRRSIRYAIERQRADVAVLAAEERYRSIFEHLVEGIFRTTPEGRYLLVNATLARIYGYDSPEQLMSAVTDIGRSLYVVPARREEFIRLMQENDVINGFQSEIYRKDGTTIWISENCRTMRDDTGRLLYYEGTVEDITERRHMEENLRNSEAVYHSLVETLPQNILRKDLQLRFTFANSNFCHTLGRRLEDVLGQTDLNFYPPELAAKYRADDQRVIASGQPLETVEEYLATNGERLLIQTVKTPVFSPGGEVIGLQCIFWDITAQKRAEEEIRRANAELARSREALHVRNVQMEEDLKMAREIQLTMLPQQYPVFPAGVPPERSAFQFTHRYLPTGTVGGDFFNISALSDTETGVFICDVMGHGVRSALVTAMVRALVEELYPIAREPGQLLSKLNSDLCAILRHTGSPLLTTAFYFVADWQTGRMRYANAGHPKPMHLRRAAGSVAPLANVSGKGQPALGLFDRAHYETSEATLARGDVVMLFTDGLYEVEGPDEQLYTAEMLQDAVMRNINLRAPELFDKLLVEIQQFSESHEFADDVCLVGIELTPPVA